MSLTVRVSLAVLVCSAGAAEAEPLFEKARLWEGIREIEVELSLASTRLPAAYTLRADPDGEPVTATSVRVFDEGFDIAFVIEDGNADLAGADLGLELPTDSRVIVIGYGDGAKVLAETDARGFSTETLRAPSTGTSRRDLAAGVELAMARLVAGGFATRRAVIVVGDGTATGGEAALPALQRLRMFAREMKISMSALVHWKGDRPHQIQHLAPMTLVAPDASELRLKARGHVRYLTDRVIVTFPEKDADGHKIAWDGTSRNLVVTVGGIDIEGDEVTLPRSRADAEACGIGSRWWLVLLVAALFVVGFWLWSRRQTPAD